MHSGEKMASHDDVHYNVETNSLRFFIANDLVLVGRRQEINAVHSGEKMAPQDTVHYDVETNSLRFFIANDLVLVGRRQEGERNASLLSCGYQVHPNPIITIEVAIRRIRTS